MARYYVASLMTRCGEYDFTEMVRFAMREPHKDLFDEPDKVAMREAFNYHNQTAQFWYNEDEYLHCDFDSTVNRDDTSYRKPTCGPRPVDVCMWVTPVHFLPMHPA